MSGLPPGKKSLPTILSDSDDAHRVIDLVILLDYLLSTFERGGVAASTRERVDSNAKYFSDKGDVHFGITVRNRLAHTDREDGPPTDAEVERASQHLARAVQELEPHLEKTLRASAYGSGRPRWQGYLMVCLVFFGGWQLFSLLTGLAIEQLGGLRGGRWFSLLIGLVLLHQVLLPRSARWIPHVTLFLRVMLGSYVLGLALAIRGLVLWSSEATQSELIESYTFGSLSEVLVSIFGEGVLAFAPWLLLTREETWQEIVRLDALSVSVFLVPLLVMLGALLWAFFPSRISRRASSQAVYGGPWSFRIGIALGAFLVVERVVAAIS